MYARQLYNVSVTCYITIKFIPWFNHYAKEILNGKKKKMKKLHQEGNLIEKTERKSKLWDKETSKPKTQMG